MSSHLIAIDPGLKPGIIGIEIESGRVQYASHRWDADWIWAASPWDIAVTELQWLFHGAGKRGVSKFGEITERNVDPNRLFGLAFRAGFGLATVSAHRRMALKPQEWRAALGFGPGRTKEQLQKSTASKLTTAERLLVSKLPASSHGDVLDAIMIGRAAIALQSTTKHDWNLTP